MKLFIDDMRHPSEVFSDGEADYWTVARDYETAIELIKSHKPQRIAFDHDLSYERHDLKTGYDLAKELIDLDISNPEDGYITDSFKFSCHSASPHGRRNIEAILHGYTLKKFW
jgi:hypothetical protein